MKVSLAFLLIVTPLILPNFSDAIEDVYESGHFFEEDGAYGYHGADDDTYEVVTTPERESSEEEETTPNTYMPDETVVPEEEDEADDWEEVYDDLEVVYEEEEAYEEEETGGGEGFHRSLLWALDVGFSNVREVAYYREPLASAFMVTNPISIQADLNEHLFDGSSLGGPVDGPVMSIGYRVFDAVGIDGDELTYVVPISAGGLLPRVLRQDGINVPRDSWQYVRPPSWMPQQVLTPDYRAFLSFHDDGPDQVENIFSITLEFEYFNLSVFAQQTITGVALVNLQWTESFVQVENSRTSTLEDPVIGATEVSLGRHEDDTHGPHRYDWEIRHITEPVDGRPLDYYRLIYMAYPAAIRNAIGFTSPTFTVAARGYHLDCSVNHNVSHNTTGCRAGVGSGTTGTGLGNSNEDMVLDVSAFQPGLYHVVNTVEEFEPQMPGQPGVYFPRDTDQIIHSTEGAFYLPPLMPTIEKSANVTESAVGEVVTYTLRVENPNELRALLDVRVVDALDTDLVELVRGSLQIDGETVGYRFENGRIEVDIDYLLPNETIDITFDVTVLAEAEGEQIPNVAHLYIYDEEEGRMILADEDEWEIEVPTILPELTIYKSSEIAGGTTENDATLISPGADLVYSVRIFNSSEASATNVTVIDEIPENLGIDSEGIRGYFHTGAPIPIEKLEVLTIDELVDVGVVVSMTENVVTWVIDELPGYYSFTLQIPTIVSVDAQAGEMIRNQAFINEYDQMEEDGSPIASEVVYHEVDEL